MEASTWCIDVSFWQRSSSESCVEYRVRTDPSAIPAESKGRRKWTQRWDWWLKDRKERGQSGVWNGTLCRDYSKNKRIVSRVSLIILEWAILLKVGIKTVCITLFNKQLVRTYCLISTMIKDLPLPFQQFPKCVLCVLYTRDHSKYSIWEQGLGGSYKYEKHLSRSLMSSDTGNKHENNWVKM